MTAVARARGALGARFRLGGRDPAFGLDCVGVVAWAHELADVPADYGLRGGDAARAATSALRISGTSLESRNP